MRNINDPDIVDWRTVELPDAWTDELISFKHPWRLFGLIGRCFAKRKRVQFPVGLQNTDIIPKYAQQEFHHLPNGNYSNTLVSGYINGFDRAMLGQMKRSRQQMASYLKGCDSVLDLGCGGGRGADAAYQIGVKDVWGVDISPYLLKFAALRHPHIKFVHAAGENLPFGDQRFDGVMMSYVLHEVPPRYVQKILAQVYRVLKTGGKLVLVEPSNLHYSHSYGWLLKRFGLKGLYFKTLSHTVHEPFVKSWHKTDQSLLFQQNGFRIVDERNDVPNHLYVFAKV